MWRTDARMWIATGSMLVAAFAWGCSDPGGGGAGGGGGALPDATGDIYWGDGAAPDEGAADVPPEPDLPGTPDDGTPDPDLPADPDTPPEPDLAQPDPGEPDTAVPAELGGGILVSEVDSEFINVAGAGARFIDKQTVAGTTIGPCVVSAYQPGATAPTTFGYDAGAIQISGLKQSVTLTPQAEGQSGTGYTSGLPEDLQDLLPGGGALIAFNAAGGAHIGAFEAVVQAPEPVTVTSPMSGLGVARSTSSDLAVTWNAGIGDQVLVLVSPLGGDYQPMKGLQALCTYQGDTGSASVPAAAVAQVRGNAGGQNAAVAVTRVKTKTAAAGDATISATVTRSSGGFLQLVP